MTCAVDLFFHRSPDPCMCVFTVHTVCVTPIAVRCGEVRLRHPECGSLVFHYTSETLWENKLTEKVALKEKMRQ